MGELAEDVKMEETQLLGSGAVLVDDKELEPEHSGFKNEIPREWSPAISKLLAPPVKMLAVI